MKTIKQVSMLSGASVRTLQYYDSIHLLTPSRTASSYRLYSDDDITKLRQILFLKELGFSLKEIRGFINNPDFNQSLAFHKQKELLLAQRRRVTQAIQILERLENGASLDDCASDIKTITKEPKPMKNSIKLAVFIIPAVLVAGALGAYLLSPRQDNPAADISPNIATDVININPAIADGATNCYAFDLVEITSTDLPENSPVPEQIAIPEDLRDYIRVEAYYPYKHEPGDQVVNYGIRAFDQDSHYIAINFSPDRTPLREMYAPKGEPSTIDGHVVMIGAVDYQTASEEVPATKYYIDFMANSMNYSVETHGLSESEMVTLVKSLL